MFKILKFFQFLLLNNFRKIFLILLKTSNMNLFVSFSDFGSNVSQVVIYWSFGYSSNHKMLKLFFIVVVTVLLTQVNSQSLEVKIATASNELAKKYCPLRNLKGELFCPFHGGAQTINSPKSDVVMSGTGFDRVKKEVKFPGFFFFSF